MQRKDPANRPLWQRDGAITVEYHHARLFSERATDEELIAEVDARLAEVYTAANPERAALILAAMLPEYAARGLRLDVAKRGKASKAKST